MRDKYTRVIVRDYPRMNEDEIEAAFKGNGSTPWFRGLVQMIEDDRHQQALNAATHASQNNALGMATDYGASEALSGLLNAIVKYAETD